MTKKKVIKRPKKAVIKIVSILVIIFSIYLLIGVGKEVYTTVQLQKRAETAEIELEKLRTMFKHMLEETICFLKMVNKSSIYQVI